jgi:hypothetical protein
MTPPQISGEWGYYLTTALKVGERCEKSKPMNVLNVHALRFFGREFSQAPATAAKRLRACLRMSFLEHEKLNIETFVTF